MHPHQLAVHLALAELEKIDHPKQALTRIKPFLRTHQYHSALLLLYADLLLQLEQPAEARRILKRYTSVLNQQPYTFDLLMRAENALHNKTGMLAAQAEIFALYGDLEQAHRTLTQAITFDDTKENNLSRLTQRRKEIEEMLAISRKF